MTLPQLFPLLAAGLCLPGLAADAAATAPAAAPAEAGLNLACVARADLPGDGQDFARAVGLFTLKDKGYTTPVGYLMLEYGEGEESFGWVPAAVFHWFEQDSEPALQLRDLDHDGTPEIVVTGTTITDSCYQMRIFRLKHGAWYMEAAREPLQQLEPVLIGKDELAHASRVRWDANGFTVFAPAVDDCPFPPASTVYLYSGGKAQALPPVQQATCPPGWQEKDYWAVRADGAALVRLKVALGPCDAVKRRGYGLGEVPPELLPEGTAADEAEPAYCFATTGYMPPNRRIYDSPHGVFAPLLPYRCSREKELHGTTLRACAPEAREGRLPVITRDNRLLLVGEEYPNDVAQELPAPFRMAPRSPETIAWVADRCFVVMAWQKEEHGPRYLAWQAYTAGRNGKFTPAASGRLVDYLHLPAIHDSALWMGAECIYRPE